MDEELIPKWNESGEGGRLERRRRKRERKKEKVRKWGQGYLVKVGPKCWFLAFKTTHSDVKKKTDPLPLSLPMFSSSLKLNILTLSSVKARPTLG